VVSLALQAALDPLVFAVEPVRLAGLAPLEQPDLLVEQVIPVTLAIPVILDILEILDLSDPQEWPQIQVPLAKQV
jgi:hypothetical protein